MENNREPGRLRNLRTYVPLAFKFYELKSEYLPPIIFLVLLAFSMASAFIEIKDNTFAFLYSFFNFIIEFLFLTVYLFACIKEFKKEAYTLSECFLSVLKNALKIIAIAIIYGAAVITGSILFIIPGVIVSVMFIFSISCLVDKNTGILESFKASKQLTDGRKGQIFVIIFMFSLIWLAPLMYLVLQIQLNRTIVTVFILQFISLLISLMQQRLIAAMYVDLEYGKDAGI